LALRRCFSRLRDLQSLSARRRPPAIDRCHLCGKCGVMSPRWQAVGGLEAWRCVDCRQARSAVSLRRGCTSRRSPAARAWRLV
jgi:hypothetical protein